MKQINPKLKTILLTCLPAWGMAYLLLHFWQAPYAWLMFVVLPFLMGLSSSAIYAQDYNVTRMQAAGVAFMAIGVFCLGLLCFAIEGVICIAMAAPISLPSLFAGHILGFDLARKRINRNIAIFLLLLFLPAIMGFDYAGKDDVPVPKPLTTGIEINASPDVVWRNVVEFPQLAPPTELLFRTGIAYPINAKIVGRGVGAVRNCNFSTGSFVEPITQWDEPSLLAFDVKEQPEPMRELSPYDLHPNHLHGYLVSKHGQFRLIPLPNGHTMLEGTTWYYNNIKPLFYWNIWSDYIIHAIHKRVLLHIKEESEAQQKVS